MLSSFLLALREGLEIALIVGIVVSALRKMERSDLLPTVRQAVGIAAGLSVGLAFLLTAIGASLEGDTEIIFEGTMMLLAAAVLTWMVLWMQSRAAHIKEDVESEVSLATKAGKGSVFLVAFFAVLREGIELALFLTAATFSSSAFQTVSGALAGLAGAALLGWGLSRAVVRLNLRHFFQVTSILLILFAAGLVAHGVHEFNEVGLIPGVIEHVWDTNGVLNESSFVGQLMKTLFGYNGNPSLTEVLSYVTYFTALFLASRPFRLPLAARRKQALS
jgi:high-affinity iron transporter